MTTIAIAKKRAHILSDMMRKSDTYDTVICRLLSKQGDVFFDFILVDNDLPQLHTAVFQLGEDKNSLYYWNGQSIECFSLEEANALAKKPKDCFVMSRKEAELLKVSLLENLEDNAFLKRLAAFTQEKDEEKKYGQT